MLILGGVANAPTLGHQDIIYIRLEAADQVAVVERFGRHALEARHVPEVREPEIVGGELHGDGVDRFGVAAVSALALLEAPAQGAEIPKNQGFQLSSNARSRSRRRFQVGLTTVYKAFDHGDPVLDQLPLSLRSVAELPL